MHMVQANQNAAPQANQVGVDQRRGNQRRNQNQDQNQNNREDPPMNQGQQQWGGQQRNYNNQNQNRNFQDNNGACYYCGTHGHRQGPNCELWCKHRTERGIPIIRYNDRQNRNQNQNQQNQPPAQLNIVMLEEIEDNPSSVAALQPEHWQCDCTDCIQVEDIPEESFAEVLAVTRSKKQKLVKPVEDFPKQKEDPT